MLTISLQYLLWTDPNRICMRYRSTYAVDTNVVYIAVCTCMNTCVCVVYVCMYVLYMFLYPCIAFAVPTCKLVVQALPSVSIAVF